ncbi:hypothetical protein V6N13_114824 [Hibiscus sabdariffa]
MNKDGRRSSIHDITSVGNGDISAPQGPITGQSTGAAAGGSSGNSAKQPPQHPAAPAGVGVYGAPTIGQPIGGPLISAVGTPVNLPGPAHMAYGVRAPVPGAVVPGAPVNMGPPTYPMPHASSHRLSLGQEVGGVHKIFKQLFGAGEEEKLLKEGMPVLSINKSRSYRWIAFHLISKGGLLESQINQNHIS